MDADFLFTIDIGYTLIHPKRIAWHIGLRREIHGECGNRWAWWPIVLNQSAMDPGA